MKVAACYRRLKFEMAQGTERESELGALLWRGFLNEGLSVRNKDGSIAIYEITPSITVPALGDLKALEAHRLHIKFMNWVLMGSARRKAYW